MNTNEALLVNLYGGPGSGKTTTALALTARLRIELGVEAEYVPEAAKSDAIKMLPPTDQLRYAWEQADAIYSRLKDSCVVVTDSPLLMLIEYASNSAIELPKKPYRKLIEGLDTQIENAIDIFIKYSNVGRYQSEEEATELSERIEKRLKKMGIAYDTVSTSNAIDRSFRLVKEWLR